jgi:hypothetical protein
VSAARWGDLRPAVARPLDPVLARDPTFDGLCHDWVWVYDRFGRYAGELDCREPWGHPGNHRSITRDWPPGVRKILTFGVRYKAQHDPRRRA